MIKRGSHLISRIIGRGRQLEDCHTVDDYGMMEGETIHLVLRLRGGGGGDVWYRIKCIDN